MTDNIYDVQVGNTLTQQQLERDRGEDPRDQEAVIASRSIDENKAESEVDVGDDDVASQRTLVYPPDVGTMPARIRFTPYSIEGTFAPDEAVREKSNRFKRDGVEEEYTTVGEDVANVAQGLKSFLNSYDNVEKGDPQGSVTLPFFRGLNYTDAVSYRTGSFGLLGNAANFYNDAGDEGLTEGAKAVAAQLAMKAGTAAAAATIGAGLGKLFDKGGSVGGAALGAVGGLGVAGAAGDLASAATRISTAPNERTLFEKVELRDFSFNFRLIAKNASEAKTIEQIVKFFREEVYPEAILGDGGLTNPLPYAYRFPNVFQIEIIAKNNTEPVPKFQRCYLESVNTQYNPTATGISPDGRFMEIVMALKFKEISALHKQRVRDGY